MLTAAYAGYALAQAALATWAFVLWRRKPSAAALTLLLPIAAVVYDNAMVALGAAIGPGPALVALTAPRFWGHALLTPLWTVTGVLFVLRVGTLAGREVVARRAVWIAYVALVVIGVMNSVVLFTPELVTEGGLVYYTNGGGLPGPPTPSIVMVVVLIASGVVVGRATGWWWMLAGSLFMLGAASVPTALVGFVVSNSGEVVLAASLVATEAFLQRRESFVPVRPSTP